MRRSDSEEDYPQFRTASMPKRPYRGGATRHALTRKKPRTGVGDRPGGAAWRRLGPPNGACGPEVLRSHTDRRPSALH